MTSPFLSKVQENMRMRGYSIRTEKAYLYWIKAFINFQHKRHPETMGSIEVTQFISYLANSRHVAVNTQKVALNALVYLYQKHLKQTLGDLGFRYSSKQRQLPTVLSTNLVNLLKVRLVFNRKTTLSVWVHPYPTHWNENTQVHLNKLDGCSYFLLRLSSIIPIRERFADIIYIKVSYVSHSLKRYIKRISLSA